MKALIDFDILRYEIGFGAETGWRTEDTIPPWDYVENMLHERINSILYGAGADSYQGYLSEGKCFRYDIAKRKPYKGTRKHTKPWHFNNLTQYMVHQLGAKVVTGIEADDQMAIDQVRMNFLISKTGAPTPTIICTRDKDLRQVPGWNYSWELWRQPSYGPLEVKKEGEIQLSEDNKKIIGNGLAFFYAQVLMGDAADNIPGLPGCGPVKACEALAHGAMLWTVEDMYQEFYGSDWEEELTEQGQLCWLVREFNEDGSPKLWEIGMEN